MRTSPGDTGFAKPASQDHCSLEQARGLAKSAVRQLVAGAADRLLTVWRPVYRSYVAVPAQASMNCRAWLRDYMQRVCDVLRLCLA